jgi:hypothetical protein
MKKLLLLLLLLPLLNACSSGNDVPDGPLVALQLQDGYLGACGSELLNMHVNITVDKYSSTAYEGVHYQTEFNTNNTQLIFYEIPIPTSDYFQVQITLQSNDCTSCCTGGCYTSSGAIGGRPLFEASTTVLPASSANGSVIPLTPVLQACN